MRGAFADARVAVTLVARDVPGPARRPVAATGGGGARQPVQDVFMSYKQFGSGEHLDDWSRKIHELMDEMFRRRFVDFRDAGPWRPLTNLYESESAFLICIELSGVDDWQVDVEAEPSPRVRVRGVRHQPRPAKPCRTLSIHLLEIDEGPFSRDVELSAPIDVGGVEASFNKGFVWISVPKITPAKSP